MGAALLLHLLLLVFVLAYVRIGPRFLPEPVAGEFGEPETVTIFWPVSPEGGARVGGVPAVPPAGARPGETGVQSAAPGAPAPLSFPSRVPTQLPAAPGGRPAPGAAPGAAGTPGGVAGAGAGASVGERLHPKGYDGRLFDPTGSPLGPAVSEHDRAMARIKGKLDAVNDSAAAVADAARKATDWTYKDKNGGRWGVTPGQLHLGNITLPLPITLGSMSSTMRAEAQKNQRDWAEIQSQVDRASARRTFDERVKAIRERKEKEKAEKEKSTRN